MREKTTHALGGNPDRERHYDCELQEEMQPGSGQIIGAVRGSGSDWYSGRELGRPIPTFCLRVWAWVIGRPFALTPPTSLFLTG